MRIDRYLHCIRLVKSRTLAQALVDAGHVRIDGKRVAKASEPVRIGSTIALPLRDRVRVLRVIALPARRGPAGEARECYRELEEPPGVDAPRAGA
ncbi:S4 domain-containing protein [Sphingomonas sp.]|uniref:RNA-binding S4 domain-containing protein n=1 Tax=Sphingomonas sp. TaxID=28214 RepID=UPI001828A7C3|nr:S4 domain-containing protein [Sphingomonas sp.]MBA3510540.1 RNA-binding S4 domain-containing protein [Sphingomonas sp.]